MTSVNRPLEPRRDIRLSYVDSFRGRARAGARAHYARARYEGRPIPGTVYVLAIPREAGDRPNSLIAYIGNALATKAKRSMYSSGLGRDGS